MKDLMKISFFIVLFAVVFLFKDNIATFITDEIIYKGSNKVLTYNEYYLENNYEYVQTTDSFNATNYQEILNIIYTIINSGDDYFSFYCNYNNCINDITNIANDQFIVSNINNFVHPYNSFNSINIDISASGRVTIKTNKVYNEEQIQYINKYIEDFINNNINLSMNNYDKIKIFHDYIINNTKYDDNNSLESYTAYNLITSGISICGGYSDILSIYLNHLNIKNYKITSENHVWNLVELDGNWYHLDATWDDPVASDGNQYLIHNFFMIDTNKLHSLDKVEHNFDKTTYKEAK